VCGRITGNLPTTKTLQTERSDRCAQLQVFPIYPHATLARGGGGMKLECGPMKSSTIGESGQGISALF